MIIALKNKSQNLTKNILGMVNVLILNNFLYIKGIIYVIKLN